MEKRFLLAVAALPHLAALPLAAQPAPGADEPWRVFDAGERPDDARLGKAVTLDGYHHWEPPATLEAWKERRAKVRRQILVAAGLWPMPPKTPLEPVIHGKIDRGEYTIEKVYFQSYPGFYVTGNLYRPKGGDDRKPGVLCPHGHWRDGRFYERSEAEAKKQIESGAEKHLSGARYPLQARCVELARMGCVVFHHDMVGYADSKQIQHRQGFGDVEAELRLQSFFGLQTWNTLRSLDFLLGLPDVDAARVGVTGASGGGTQTFILCAVDERPRAGFPAVMVSTGMQGGCVCENASHLRVGTTNIEFAALAAPRPYAMTGANDWTLQILEKGLPELDRTWNLYGKAEFVEAWCHPEFGHNYNQVSREHMYAWFNRHLELGFTEPIEERPFEPVPPAELSVWTDGHELPEDAVDAAGLRRYLTEVSERQLRELVPEDRDGLREFRRVIGGGLEAILHTSLPAKDEVEAEERAKTELEGVEIQKLVLRRRGSGEAVPAILLEPEEWGGTVVVAVDSDGKGAACFGPSLPSPSGIKAEVRGLLERRVAVLAPDVFLTGEYLGDAFRTAAVDFQGHAGVSSALFGKDDGRHGSFVGYTYGYNRTLLAQRVHDVLTTVAYARSRPGCRTVNLFGKDASSWVILARALAGDAVGRAWVTPQRGGPVDFSAIESHDDPDFLPGALRYGGMPYFTALCAPAPLRLVAPSGTKLVSRPVVEAAYRAAGAPDGVESVPVGRDAGKEKPIDPGEPGPKEAEFLDWISR